MEEIELIARSQRPLVTPPVLTPTGLESEGHLPLLVPTGIQSGGIYLKVTRYLEGKKYQGLTTVFSNNTDPICCPTRSRHALMHQ